MTNSRVQVTPGGWVVDGKRRILLCASLFYFRIPPECWRDRIERAAQSGYHALDVYIPWNFHEPERGEYLFEGDRDVRRFLRLARDAGLYVVARPGPYICSEWDGGALPAWLYPRLARPVEDSRTGTVFHSGHERLRQADGEYLAEVARWYGAVMPFLREEQIDEGGAVIAVQIDNELDFYPCEDPKAYLAFLRDQARAHGIRVPLLACSGEDGVSAATGDLEDVVPTANVYSRYRWPGLEERVRKIAVQLERRGAPLTITETDRPHYTLRRLLSAGARFIGPYLQVSGHHTGYYAGQNNWGKPSTFLQNDYDFGGMVGPDGELREEYYEGRLLAGFIESFEPELVASRAETGEVLVRAGGKSASPGAGRSPGAGEGWSGDGGEPGTRAPGSDGDGVERRRVYILKSEAGPQFTFLANLEDAPMEVLAPQRAVVPPHRVAILPERIDLSPRGVPAVLAAANTEVCAVRPLEDGCLVVAVVEEGRAARELASGRSGVRSGDGLECYLCFETAEPVEVRGRTGGVEVEAVEMEGEQGQRVVVALRNFPARQGEAQLPYALLEVGGRRLLVLFAPRDLAGRIWRVDGEGQAPAGGATAPTGAAAPTCAAAPVYEVGWDWVSHSGERVLYDGRGLFRIGPDGRIERLDPEVVRRWVRSAALPAEAVRAYRRVRAWDPTPLLQALPADERWEGSARYLEELGVCYGAAYYAFTVPIQDEKEFARGLWFAGASDAVSFYVNGKYLGTALPRGRSVALAGPLPWKPGENRVVVRAEIMGHSNFHDTTVPVTHLGSMRGLAPPVVVADAAPGAREHGEHLERAPYPSPDPAFLYGVPEPPGKTVEGVWELWRAGKVEGSPWAGGWARPGLGREAGPDGRAAESADGFAEAFPCRVPAGRFVEVEVPVPAASEAPHETLPLWVKLSGRGVRGELWLAERLAGRFWLEKRKDLLFTGGRWTDRIWLPTSWCAGGVLTIRLFGAAKEGGVLEGVEWISAFGGRPAVEKRSTGRGGAGIDGAQGK